MHNHYKNGLSQHRFQFGKNWAKFLSLLNENRILEAEKSLLNMLEVVDLKDKTFLDIGSGSGLFSLAAKRLGAKVHSFYYDPESVNCTLELKKRYYPDNNNWKIEKGSILDADYLASLGEFDFVYSWGVLHHTGNMFKAFKNLPPLVTKGGKLYISIYNDQGFRSRMWTEIKKAYNRLPNGLHFLILWPSIIRLWGRTFIKDLVRARPFYSWRNYSSSRGMSAWHDVIDWVGGYPFEVAKPEKVFYFFKNHDFHLVNLVTCGGGHGCNTFVFKKSIS